MQQQLDIFEHATGGEYEAPPRVPPRARRDDPVTSQLAAARAGDLARDHQARILEALDRDDGTIYELAERAKLTHVQVARRMPELEQAGEARTHDETRPGPSGRGCRVWARCP